MQTILQEEMAYHVLFQCFLWTPKTISLQNVPLETLHSQYKNLSMERKWLATIVVSLDTANVYLAL